MKLRNITEVDGFIKTVDSCKGSVWLESPDGDIFNLKSKFSQYVAIGALLGADGDKLELFCSNTSDEYRFFSFFYDNPSVN